MLNENIDQNGQFRFYIFCFNTVKEQCCMLNMGNVILNVRMYLLVLYTISYLCGFQYSEATLSVSYILLSLAKHKTVNLQLVSRKLPRTCESCPTKTTILTRVATLRKQIDNIFTLHRASTDKRIINSLMINV